MNWWQSHNFKLKRDNLLARAQVIKALRSFFDGDDFVEVQTPALQICPVMDTHIHAFKTVLKDICLDDSKALYLHTSPEFDMKKLLAAGMERIYQICPVYRNAEGSVLHSPEFTLLEWYRSSADYISLMDDCMALLRGIAKAVDVKEYSYQGVSCDPFAVWQKISVCEAFQQYTGVDLEGVLDDRDGFADIAKSIGVRVIVSDRWDDIFHAVMAEKIEPFLGQGVPTILYDYPVSMAALSRRKIDDSRFAERFELYVCGVELANAFSELTDPVEQRTRFEEDMHVKLELYGEVYPADESFFAALKEMPDSAGIALGVDRLVMLVCGAKNINDVLWAPVQSG